MRKREAKNKKTIFKPAVTMAFAQTASADGDQLTTQTDIQKVAEQAVKDAKATMDLAKGKLDEANERLATAQDALNAAQSAQAAAQTAYDQVTADAEAASDAKAAADQKLTEAKAAYDAAAAKATELHNYTPTELRAYTQTGGKKRAPRKALFEFSLNSVAMPNAHRPARYACRSTS